MLVAGVDPTRFAGAWAVREDGAFLDKRLVGKYMVKYEDEGAWPNTKGEDRAVL